MEKFSKICIGCLSSDRKLSPIRREERNDFFNSCLSSKVNISEPLHMCWECIALIRKAIRFKVRVQKSIAFLDQLNTSKNLSSLSTLTHRSIPQDDTILYTYEEKARDLEHSTKEHIIREKIEFTGAGYTETNKTDSKKPTVPSTIFFRDDDSIALTYDPKSTEILADSRDEHVKGEIEFTDTGLPEPVKLEPKIEFISEDNLNEVDVSVDNSDAGEDFNVSDDEPLVSVKVQKEKEVRGKSRKKTRFNITNKPSGVINNVSVQKQLKKWNITDDRVEMLLLSWDEVKEERQRALQALSVAQNAYKCDDCVLGFNHRFKFDNHMKKHDQSAGECICSICSIRCRHERALSQHLRRHRVRWRCRECFASYSRAEVLADHVTTSHQLPASRQCHLCDYTASTLSKLRSHMRVHREPKRCQVCARTFTSTTSLHTHMMIHKGEKEFSCPKCEKQFLFKSAMETHLMTHDNSIKLYCHECDVTFKNRNSYAQHMKYNSKHIDPARLKFECESCGKKFAQAHRLNEHKMAVHLKLTPIACPTPNCTFTCSSRSVLRSHMGVVHRNTRSIRNHVCHVCGKAYITKRNLESHIRAHTGERPFVCSVCPASFAHDAALYNHRRLLHSAPPNH